MQVQPSARVFLGYDNHMNADWNFLTGVEVLVDLRGDPHWRNVRLNWRNTLGVSLSQDLGANVLGTFVGELRGHSAPVLGVHHLPVAFDDSSIGVGGRSHDFSFFGARR